MRNRVFLRPVFKRFLRLILSVLLRKAFAVNPKLFVRATEFQRQKIYIAAACAGSKNNRSAAIIVFLHKGGKQAYNRYPNSYEYIASFDILGQNLGGFLKSLKKIIGYRA